MTWLERDGSLITGGVYWDVKIYDGVTLVKTLTLNTEAYKNNLDPDGGGSPYTYEVGPSILLTGTTTANASTTITGTNTLFTKELGVGNEIMLRSASAISGKATVTAINSDTSLTIDTPLGDGTAQSILAGSVNGSYGIFWNETTLESGKVYNVVTRVQIGTGGTFNTPSSLNITREKQMTDLIITVDEKLDRPMSEVRFDVVSAVQAKMDIQTSIIQEQMDNLETTLGLLTGSVAEIDSAAADLTVVVGSAKEELTKLAEAAEVVEIAGRKFAPELLLPSEVFVGNSLRIRYSSFGGFIPLLKVLTYDNEVVFDNVPMVESEAEEGLYEYEIEEITSDVFEVGMSLAIIVTEAVTQNLESGSVMVKTTDYELLLPRTVLLGDRLEIRYRSIQDIKPEVQVLTYDSKEAIPETAMDKVTEEPGLYEYVIPEIKGEIFRSGKPLTIIVTDKKTANQAYGSVLVESTTLSSLEGLVASGSGGMKKTLKDVEDAIKGVGVELDSGGSIHVALKNLDEKVEEIPQEVARRIEEGGSSEKLMLAVGTLTDNLTTFLGEEILGFDALLEAGLEKSKSLRDIRKKATRIQGATGIIQRIIEEQLLGRNKPFVFVIYE
jgi:hypothetical protein